MRDAGPTPGGLAGSVDHRMRGWTGGPLGSCTSEIKGSQETSGGRARPWLPREELPQTLTHSSQRRGVTLSGKIQILIKTTTYVMFLAVKSMFSANISSP